VQLNILEHWNNPPTSPLSEVTQSIEMGSIDATAYAYIFQIIPPNSPLLNILKQTYLAHDNFFTVPPQQTVEFEVGMFTSAEVYTTGDASGSSLVNFMTDGRA
jgi:hypothetical protein